MRYDYVLPLVRLVQKKPAAYAKLASLSLSYITEKKRDGYQ